MTVRGAFGKSPTLGANIWPMAKSAEQAAEAGGIPAPRMTAFRLERRTGRVTVGRSLP
jgi:hypothetical protein